MEAADRGIARWPERHALAHIIAACAGSATRPTRASAASSAASRRLPLPRSPVAPPPPHKGVPMPMEAPLAKAAFAAVPMEVSPQRAWPCGCLPHLRLPRAVAPRPRAAPSVTGLTAKSDGMVVSADGAKFQWYFTGPKSFGGILRSPRRRRDDRRRESDRSHYRSRDEESAEVADHDQKRNRDTAQGDDPPNAESKSASDVKNGPSTRHERSPRGTKRFSESREAWRPRSFFQHNERGSAGQGGRHYDRQASDYGRQREHLSDRDKQKTEGHSLQGKVELDQQKKDGDSAWKHDGFFQMEEEAPLAKKRPPFQEMKIQESAATVTEPDSRSRKLDQPGLTSAMREERKNYHARGFGNHRPFLRPDDRGFRRGFPDHRSDGQTNGYDSRGRFPGRGGMDRDRFNNPYGGRSNVEASGDQEEKWKHDLYDQTNRSPPPKTEEEQIAKVEALLAL